MRNTKPLTEKNLYSKLMTLKKSLLEGADGAKSHAVDMVTELIGDLDSVKSECQGYAEQYVKSYPFKSIGIAAVFGLFLGKFIL